MAVRTGAGACTGMSIDERIVAAEAKQCTTNELARSNMFFVLLCTGCNSQKLIHIVRQEQRNTTPLPRMLCSLVLQVLVAELQEIRVHQIYRGRVAVYEQSEVGRLEAAGLVLALRLEVHGSLPW